MDEDDFEKVITDKKEVKEYKKFLDEFDFNDAVKGVFCFNSYLGNRSHLTLVFRLNYCLSNHSHNGTKKIESYRDFCAFCGKFVELYDAAEDDDVSLDNGEILYKYNDQFRKCILGNGYNRSYAFYNSLYNFGKSLNVLDKLEIVLNNNDLLVSFISENNFKPNEYDHSYVYVPDKEYFDYIFVNYEDFKEKYKVTEYDSQQHRIIDTIALVSGGKAYPLFNVSGPISYTCHLIKELSIEELTSIINVNLVNTVFDMYDHSFNDYVLGGAFIKEIDSHALICNQVFDLIILYKSTLILFKISHEWTHDEEKQFTKELKECLKDKKVIIYSKLIKEGNAVEITNVDDVIIYNLFPGLWFELDQKLAKNMNNIIHYYDLIQILLLSSSIDEIARFFFLFAKKELSFTTNTVTDFFILFQSQQGNLQLGATSFGSYLFDVYTTEWQFYGLFKEFRTWFHFNNKSTLRNPFYWIFESESNGVFEFTNKRYSKSVFSLVYKTDKTNIVFNFNPIISDQYEIDTMTNLGLLRDLITNYLPNFKSFFNNTFDCDSSFIYMSREYALKLKGFKGFASNHKYVFSDCVYFDNQFRNRYCIDFEKFKDDENNSKDNSVEITFWKELFECFFDFYLKDDRKALDSLNNMKGNKKELALFTFIPKCYYSNRPTPYLITNEMEAEVSKMFSFCAKNSGISEGEYTKKEFREKVRIFQSSALDLFERKVSEYDLYNLHILLLSILSSLYFDRIMVAGKQEALAKEEYSEQCRRRARDNTLDQENSNKFVIRAIHFLMDTNLAITHTGGITPSVEDASKLICMARFLVGIQDDSDIANYDIAPIKLKVNYDYRVTPIYGKETAEKMLEKSRRILNCRAYIPALKTDLQYHIDKVKKNFIKDTGVNFVDVKNILVFLSDSIGYEGYEITANVIKIDKGKLINDIKEQYDLHKLDFSGVEKALEFLTIKYDQIKIQKGHLEQHVPIWNREGRPDRFEIRPLVDINGNYLYSPVHCFNVDKLWRDGFANFYLPYEYGLEQTRDYLVNTWKPECEKLMEKDIKELFVKAGIRAIQGVDLASRFPNNSYSNDLGDYDVLAIDEENKLIYNIESKYLSFQGSIKEYYNFQDWFFKGSNRRDRVFKRRIEYLKHHTEKVMKDLFNKTNVFGYEIKNLMVTNKILTCDLGKVDFDIISFSELEDMIKK